MEEARPKILQYEPLYSRIFNSRPVGIRQIFQQSAVFDFPCG